MHYYKNTEQISEINADNPYKFQLPKYPKTTTDITFYEPTATRIANMRKSASGGKSLYDFEAGYEVPDVEETHVMFGRKPGLTLEEVSAVSTRNTLKMKQEIKEADDSSEAELKAIEKESKKAVAISKAIRISDDAGTSSAE